MCVCVTDAVSVRKLAGIFIKFLFISFILCFVELFDTR